MLKGCILLESIELPTGVMAGETASLEIGEYAFSQCVSLKEIVLGENVATIEKGAFYGCSSLTIKYGGESKPNGWHEDWNESNCPVIWGAVSESKEEQN